MAKKVAKIWLKSTFNSPQNSANFRYSVLKKQRKIAVVSTHYKHKHKKSRLSISIEKLVFLFAVTYISAFTRYYFLVA